jgi:hypothetical protein
MQRIILPVFLFFFLCLPEVIAAQPVKQVRASRALETLIIDGKLDEAEWKQAQDATNFIQNWPVPGVSESHQTVAKVLYDDAAIYIGAVMYDVAADSILRQLVRRDEIGNSDYFAVYLDTYHDKINGYGFTVTAAGVQSDARYSSNGQDRNWNAVWHSKVTIHADRWIVEMKIPYSAIRFSKREDQVWGINFKRQLRRKNEAYYWNPIQPSVSGFLNQFGELRGIEQIKSPLRLSFMPYVSSYADNSPAQGGKNVTSTNITGGMDVKYGINESFTLDMTLVPDFGQVQSDNQVLNLSPFEVRFDENRQFFTEGTELFNKGGFFYSRRIGGKPLYHGKVNGQLEEGERIVDNPTTSRLVNASKVSGRTPGGLGVGVFNAVSANMYATVENEEGEQRQILTQPLTNYSIVVLDQSMKNNSYVSLINTNVARSGAAYDANLTGGLFRFADKKNMYSLRGRTALSQIFNPADQGPDLGYTLSVTGGKISGNFQYDFTQVIESHTYNPNDMGIVFNNNEITQQARVEYNIFKPFWKMNNLNADFGVTYSRLYQPYTFQHFVMNGSVYTTLKNFYRVGSFVQIQPVQNIDFYEPRVAGRFYALPTNVMVGSDFSTDTRKRLALDVYGRYRTFNENNRNTYHLGISPRYRVNDKLSFRYNLDTRNSTDDIGSFGGNVRNDSIFFGLRNVKTIASTLNSSYIFTNRMSLTLRARHYNSAAMYQKYFALTENGGLAEAEYDVKKDVNFNTFNVDMVFSWWFAPGSEISLVWKNAVFTDGSEMAPSYADNFNRTMQAPQSNNISVKVLYYLDALMFKGKNPGNKIPDIITRI